jgi:hypothetical protein
VQPRQGRRDSRKRDRRPPGGAARRSPLRAAKAHGGEGCFGADSIRASPPHGGISSPASCTSVVQAATSTHSKRFADRRLCPSRCRHRSRSSRIERGRQCEPGKVSDDRIQPMRPPSLRRRGFTAALDRGRPSAPAGRARDDDANGQRDDARARAPRVQGRPLPRRLASLR